ncbi:MAG TPA: alpha-L-arabinofuranosidase C-terminal domain-containing protein, partial [Verrucomicrobiae bacterium]|nr:alpha-L-arabinofuranosidase C-terminal domain-containing protein [Verrucomicrobiae bacterium]
GALGEAAFMTGLERNSDIVAMASYAPLFANLNNKNWNPDLIYFNGAQVYGTPSYYVQQMFSLNRGDVVLPGAVSVAAIPVTNHGAIGLSRWNTQAAFTNVVVTKNGQTLFQSDFSQGSAGWQIVSGSWVTTGGVFEQTAGGTDDRATTGDPSWSDYTLTLQAKKLSGAEGFLIMFNVQDSQDWMWLNIGGWGNTQTAVERSQNGGKTTIPGTAFPQQILTGQWYTIQVRLGGPHVQCYLNGALIEDFFTSPAHEGAIGMGTWNTQSAYSNLVVTAGSQTLYQSDFTQGSAGWQIGTGTWITTNGGFEQIAGGTDNTATSGNTTWSNYTYNLRALKLGGSEGFLVLFNFQNSSNWFWWNIGGWNNTQTGIEYTQNGQKSLLTAVPMQIQTGQWYDISIQLGARIRCLLNGQLIHDVPYPDALNPLFVSTALSQGRGQIILKAVNVSSQPLPMQVAVNSARGLASNATATVLTSANPLDENNLAQPAHVTPITNAVAGLSTNFPYSFPANSLTILRLQQQPDFPVGIGFGSNSIQQDLSVLSNGVPVRLGSFITNAVSVNYTVDSPAGVFATGVLQFAP